jgi:hypothetical protein
MHRAKTTGPALTLHGRWIAVGRGEAGKRDLPATTSRAKTVMVSPRSGLEWSSGTANRWSRRLRPGTANHAPASCSVLCAAAANDDMAAAALLGGAGIRHDENRRQTAAAGTRRKARWRRSASGSGSAAAAGTAVAMAMAAAHRSLAAAMRGGRRSDI